MRVWVGASGLTVCTGNDREDVEGVNVVSVGIRNDEPQLSVVTGHGVRGHAVVADCWWTITVSIAGDWTSVRALRRRWWFCWTADDCATWTVHVRTDVRDVAVTSLVVVISTNVDVATLVLNHNALVALLDGAGLTVLRGGLCLYNTLVDGVNHLARVRADDGPLGRLGLLRGLRLLLARTFDEQVSYLLVTASCFVAVLRACLLAWRRSVLLGNPVDGSFRDVLLRALDLLELATCAGEVRHVTALDDDRFHDATFDD